jgi:hypothetical protein
MTASKPRHSTYIGATKPDFNAGKESERVRSSRLPWSLGAYSNVIANCPASHLLLLLVSDPRTHRQTTLLCLCERDSSSTTENWNSPFRAPDNSLPITRRVSDLASLRLRCQVLHQHERLGEDNRGTLEPIVSNVPHRNGEGRTHLAGHKAGAVAEGKDIVDSCVLRRGR